MPENSMGKFSWNSIKITYCHRNWKTHTPVQMEFKNRGWWGMEANSASIVVGMNGSGKTTLFETIVSFFSRIGDSEHPSQDDIDEFKRECKMKGVSLFEVEIEFTIHHDEYYSSDDMRTLNVPFDDEYYRATLELDSTVDKLNDVLNRGDGNVAYFVDYMDSSNRLTKKTHLLNLKEDERYYQEVMDCVYINPMAVNHVKSHARYIFDFDSGESSCQIDIEFDIGVHHDSDYDDLDFNRNHTSKWESTSEPFGPADFESLFKKALTQFNSKFETKISVPNQEVICLPKFDIEYISSENIKQPEINNKVYNILNDDSIDSVELELYLEDKSPLQILNLMNAKLNTSPIRTYEEFPIDPDGGSVQEFLAAGNDVIEFIPHPNKINIDQNAKIASLTIGRFGQPYNKYQRGKKNGWDKFVEYHTEQTVWCVSFSSSLTTKKSSTKKIIESLGDDKPNIYRHHSGVVCHTEEGIVYSSNKEALANFIKYELFRYINVRQKCEVLSKIFGVKANDVYALYEVKSFGIQVTDGYLTSGQRRLHHIFSSIRHQKNNIYLIDEPEVSLHIDWQREIVDKIGEATNLGFVLIATHSPDVIYHHHNNVIDLGSEIEE